jgi:hypothetical protein
METQPDSSNGASESEQTNFPVKKPSSAWGQRLIGYVKRKMDERRAHKQNETPADKAAKVTAWATALMALFTFVLAIVSWSTLREIHTGSADTRRLATAAQVSADAEVSASRAWMVPTGEVKVGGVGAPIILYWKNAGKSPAIHVRAKVEYTMDNPAANISRGCDHLVTQPGWSVTSALVLPDHPFDVTLLGIPDEWKAAPLTSHRNFLEAHGCVSYTDVVTNLNRTTEFCYTAMKYKPTGNGTPKVSISECGGIIDFLDFR